MGITQQIGASSIIKPGVIDNAAARPASPYEGQVIFQKDTDQLLVWNGTAWVIPNSPTQNPQGLELITTVTCSSGGTASNGVVTVGSAQSSVVMDNAFSSSYDNYLITWNDGTMSTQTALKVKLNNISSTNYFGALIYTSVNSGTPVGAVDNAQTHWAYCGGGNSSAAGSYFELHNPFLGKHKFVRNSSILYGPATDGAVGVYNGYTNATTSCTGFSFVPFTGTMTGGTVRVYGYRNS